MEACDLNNKHCTPCEGGVPPLSPEESGRLLEQLDGWVQFDHLISKTFEFADYHQTIAFVNLVAWISHREGHHPNLRVSYNKCEVEYFTHAIGGLSENDFICAAKIDAHLRT